MEFGVPGEHPSPNLRRRRCGDPEDSERMMQCMEKRKYDVVGSAEAVMMVLRRLGLLETVRAPCSGCAGQLLLQLLLPLTEAACGRERLRLPPLPVKRAPFSLAPSQGSRWGGGGVFTVCGKPKVVGKVFGGQDVVAGQWPWQASLLYQGWHFCGAVLIDTQWVVSAAHCFLNKSHAPEDYQVLLGNTQLYEETQHTRKMPVNRIIIHPDFEKFHPFGSDIVMLQLYLPVNFTSHIIPACLPNPDILLPSYTSCWITGWGMLTENSESTWWRRGQKREDEGRETDKEGKRKVWLSLRGLQAKRPRAVPHFHNL
nr:LOW QUALITY PROTEIN: putative serine protease 47 [Loxodonta africana]